MARTRGYINPSVMNFLLGETGGYLLLTMMMMALMSTGSGEIMAISSIVVYNIYKTYINPFSSCMVWVVILIVPDGLLISETDINVNWATLGLEVLICPFLMPLFLTITWSKATAKGAISDK
ncbi:DUR3-like protein [Mya arenaria]|uniref:DUR3-like protein n=1 Tax=Mya arenaria TaxID=6604 RepID=A0ABY7DRL1_MYAAR|nr:DUR3-like protein [Mya arenaria]